jgi:hypothetical protein
MRATTSAPSLFSNNLNQKSDDDDGGEDAEKVLIWRRRKNLLQMMDVFNVGCVWSFFFFSSTSHSKSEPRRHI